MASRKKPVFANRDPKEIEKKQNNGGLSENTKARRLGVNNVFDDCQKQNNLPTLKERCEARDKEGLESDIQGFFQSYYIRIDEIADLCDDETEYDVEDEDFDSEEEDHFDSEGEEENDDPNDKSEDKEKNDTKEVRIRPKGNTALAYKSHIKQLVLSFTNNEFDISDKIQFPNFYVSNFFCVKECPSNLLSLISNLIKF